MNNNNKKSEKENVINVSSFSQDSDLSSAHPFHFVCNHDHFQYILTSLFQLSKGIDCMRVVK